MINQKLQKHLDTLKEGIIAIDGPSASGKTTLSKELNQRYNWTVIHMDDYFLDASRRTSNIAGNIDFNRLKEEVFDRLDKEYIISNSFNCKMNQLEERPKLIKTDVIVIEGAYSMHPSLMNYYDLTIFIEVDEKIQKTRIIDRSSHEKYIEFKDKWIPRENKYFKEYDIKNQADIIIKEI